MREHETLQSAETPRSEHQGELAQGSVLTAERAAQVFAERQQMLMSLKGDINPSLYEILDKKIRYEERALCELIQADRRVRETHTALNKVLPAEYFVHTRLEVTFI